MRQRVPADIVAIADYSVIPEYMFGENGQQKYTDWYVGFASNAITFVYTNKSKGQDQINNDNWYQVLAQKGVQIGRSNPDIDTSGVFIKSWMDTIESGRYPLRATWLYLVGLIVSLGVFSTAIYISILPVAREPWPPAAASGKRIWQAKGCIECHTLLGNGGYAAGDLTRVTTTTSREELLTFLTQPPIMRPSRRQPHPALTREEADGILDFLEQVAKINTGSWPPPPFRPVTPAGGKETP